MRSADGQRMCDVRRITVVSVSSCADDVSGLQRQHTVDYHAGWRHYRYHTCGKLINWRIWPLHLDTVSPGVLVLPLSLDYTITWIAIDYVT